MSSDAVLAFVVALGAHGLVLAWSPEGGGDDAGAGGEHALSLAASSQQIVELVQRWETPAPAETASPIMAPVEASVDGAATLPSHDGQIKMAAPSALGQVAVVEPPKMARPTELDMSPPARTERAATTGMTASEPTVVRMSPPTAMHVPDQLAAPPIEASPSPPDSAPVAAHRPVAKPVRSPAPAVARKIAAGAGLGARKGTATSRAEATASSPAARQAAQAAWAAQIQKRVARFQRYPRGGRGDGRVKVAMVIHANGQLGKVSITQSSGAVALDEAALQAVRQAAPFPPAPDSLTDKYFTVGQWIRFARR